MIRDIDDSRQKLRWQSEHDPLTGVANRRRLEHLAEGWLQDRTFEHLAVFMIDVDYFKPFNDNYGHVAGDKALKEVAAKLDALFQYKSEVVARFGGEEFCIIIASSMPIDCDEVSSRIHFGINELQIEHAHSAVSPYLTVSIGGLYSIGSKKNSYANLVRLADKELYQAKQSGRNRSSVMEMITLEEHSQIDRSE